VSATIEVSAATLTTTSYATIGGSLSAKTITAMESLSSPTISLTTLQIGSATLTWDSTNKALKVAGGSIIAENDVIALGTTTSSGLKTISVETVTTDNELTLYSDSTLTINSNNSDVKIAANDDVYFSSQNSLFNSTTLSTIIAKINELAKAAGKSTI
jgi:hypothetical protein